MTGEYYHTMREVGGIFLPVRLRPENNDCMPLCWRMRDIPEAICFGFFNEIPLLSPEDAEELLGDFVPFSLQGDFAYFPKKMLSILGGERDVVLVGVNQHAEVYARSEWERIVPSPEELEDFFTSWSKMT